MLIINGKNVVGIALGIYRLSSTRVPEIELPSA